MSGDGIRPVATPAMPVEVPRPTLWPTAVAECHRSGSEMDFFDPTCRPIKPHFSIGPVPIVELGAGFGSQTTRSTSGTTYSGASGHVELEAPLVLSRYFSLSTLGRAQIGVGEESVKGDLVGGGGTIGTLAVGLGLKAQAGMGEFVNLYATGMPTANASVGAESSVGMGVRVSVGGEIGPLYIEGARDLATNGVTNSISMGLRIHSF